MSQAREGVETRFRVRGWRAGDGWVEVSQQGDLDAATLAALEACDSFRLVEVVDGGGEVLVAVDGQGASVPHRCRGVISKSALPFFRAALRLELASSSSDEGSGPG